MDSNTTPVQTKQRSRLLAFLFSAVEPGLGQLYKGQIKKAAFLFGIRIFAALAFFILLVSGFFELKVGLVVVLASALLFLLIFLWSLIDAVKGCKQPLPVYWYNRWYIYVGILALGFLLPTDNLKLWLRREYLEAFKIPSGAMIHTLEIGDHILVSKRHYKKNPIARGDIIVFTRNDDPKTEEDESKVNIIKRVIGLPGDQIKIHDNILKLNGSDLSEPYALYDEGSIERPTLGPITVPNDSVFLLGDNRDHSKDSRYWPETFIPITNIKGKALYIYWSWAGHSRIGTDVK